MTNRQYRTSTKFEGQAVLEYLRRAGEEISLEPTLEKKGIFIYQNMTWVADASGEKSSEIKLYTTETKQQIDWTVSELERKITTPTSRVKLLEQTK